MFLPSGHSEAQTQRQRGARLSSRHKPPLLKKLMIIGPISEVTPASSGSRTSFYRTEQSL